MLMLKDEIASYKSEIIALRRDFHRHPETGYKEYRTSKTIYDYLKSLKTFEIESLARTGIAATIYGNSAFGKTIMLRANMDALPIVEENDFNYKSENPGVMHASGHDAQMAVALVVAKLLSRHQENFKGAVKIVFQPNEERAGALDMINEGVLEHPRVDAALAMYFTQMLDSGEIGLSKGTVLGNTEEFKLSITGKSGNTYLPHRSRDAALCAAKIMESVQLLESREYDPFMPVAVMFGKVHGGNARNVVIDKMILEGTIRFLDSGMETKVDDLKESFERIVKSCCKMMKTKYSLEFIHSNTELRNDETVVENIRRCAHLTYGTERGIHIYKSLMGEDFAEFSGRIPSAITFFGINNPAKDCIFPNYHPKYNIDEDILTSVVEYYYRSILELLLRL